MITGSVLTYDDCLDILHRSYGVGNSTNEVVSAPYAKSFASPVSWSRGFDIDVPGYSEIRGMRFMDFKDCTNYFILLKSGEVIDIFDPRFSSDKGFREMFVSLADAVVSKWPNHTAFVGIQSLIRKVNGLKTFKKITNCQKSIRSNKHPKIK